MEGLGIIILVTLGFFFVIVLTTSVFFAIRVGLAQVLFGIPFLLIAGWFCFQVTLGRWQILLSPLAAILLGFEVFILLGPILLPTWSREIYTNAERIFQAWIAVLLGLIAFLTGYSINHKAKFIRPDTISYKFLYRDLRWKRVILIGILLIIIRLFFLAKWYSVSGKSEELLTAGHFATKLAHDQIFLWGGAIMGWLTMAAVASLAAVVFTTRPFPLVYRFLAFLPILVASYSTFLEGNRGRFAMPIITAFILFFCFGLGKKYTNNQIGRFQRILSIFLAAAVALGIIWQTHFRTYRLDEAQILFAEQGFSKKGGFYTERGFDMIPYLDRLLQEIGVNENYYMGYTYILPFVLLIPRMYWPDKPRSIAEYLNNAGPTIIGEWYANFGWLGIIVGMFIFGYILKWFWMKVLLHWKSDYFKIFYAITFASLIYQVRGDFHSVTSYWLYSSFLFSFIWLLSSTSVSTKRPRS
jgi:oligosaccharide repeat unit polymerase